MAVKKTVVKLKPKAKTAEIKKKAPKTTKVLTAEGWKRSMIKLHKGKTESKKR